MCVFSFRLFCFRHFLQFSNLLHHFNKKTKTKKTEEIWMLWYAHHKADTSLSAYADNRKIPTNCSCDNLAAKQNMCGHLNEKKECCWQHTSDQQKCCSGYYQIALIIETNDNITCSVTSLDNRVEFHDFECSMPLIVFSIALDKYESLGYGARTVLVTISNEILEMSPKIIHVNIFPTQW